MDVMSSSSAGALTLPQACRVRFGRAEVEVLMQPMRPPRANWLSGSELRQLLELRERIKLESFRLPAGRQRQILDLLERSRPWAGAPPPLPEMSRGELVRAIRWRLGTISLPTAEAAAKLLDQTRRKRR